MIFEIPTEHKRVLDNIVKNGSIIDYEADFENAVEYDGACRYFVWLEAPKEEL